MDYSVIDRYIDRLIAETTPDAPVWNIENIRHGKPAGWNYIDGCMLTVKSPRSIPSTSLRATKNILNLSIISLTIIFRTRAKFSATSSRITTSTTLTRAECSSICTAKPAKASI